MEQAWKMIPVSSEAGPELELPPGHHVLGSARDADLRLRHPTVSRRHARIVCSDGAVTIEDLDSTNGTRVNGDRIDGPVTLHGRSTLEFGEVTVVLEPPGAALDGRAGAPGAGASVLLGPSTVAFLRDAGEEVAFHPGEVIVRRGESQDVFYVVIDGEVELRLEEEGHRRRPMARLGSGAIFGAESVVAREGAAADAVAVTPLRLLRYPAAALPDALRDSESLRRKLLGGIARHLHEATEDALDLMHGTEVIARLVQGDTETDTLVAVSARMRAVRKRILECASGTAPVLLVAEHGTGKTSAARRIHAESSRADGPLIAVRCRDLSPGNEGAALILGREAGGRRESGGIHLAHEGTLVLRDADTLEPYLQMMLARHLQQMRSRPAGAYPDTRVILTARADTVREGTGSGLEQALLDAVETVIRIPALADRPRDIVPLAEEFLKAHGKSAPALTESAKRALASLSFRRRNVRELREVVDLAVRCADGPEIRAEHIFGGVAEEATPGIDITSTPVVRRLLRPLVLGLLRGATLLGFVAVIVVCLAMPGSWAGRNANAAIWSVWEPAVFGLFLLAGPVWCTVCPLSTAARWLRRVRGSDRPPPAWLQRHGPWIAVAGFAAIVWSEHVFDTLNHARASGLLLGCLLAAATIGVLAYQREVWCRYLCPLGRLGAALAPAAPLQIAANPRVCASSCTSHACYKGAAEIPGCTVFHHPLEARQAYRCKLCLDCLKSCPHGSARLQIRPPLAAVWSVDGRAADIALFGVAVSLLALVLVAARAYPVIAGPARFTLLCVLALLLGSVLHRAVLRWAGTERRSAIVVRASVTLMVLGWSALMVGQLGNVPTLAGARLELEPAAWMPAWMPTGYSVLTLLQIGLVAIGFLLSSISLDQIRAREGRRGARAGWALAFLGLMAYAGGVLALALA